MPTNAQETDLLTPHPARWLTPQQQLWPHLTSRSRQQQQQQMGRRPPPPQQQQQPSRRRRSQSSSQKRKRRSQRKVGSSTSSGTATTLLLLVVPAAAAHSPGGRHHPANQPLKQSSAQGRPQLTAHMYTPDSPAAWVPPPGTFQHRHSWRASCPEPMQPLLPPSPLLPSAACLHPLARSTHPEDTQGHVHTHDWPGICILFLLRRCSTP